MMEDPPLVVDEKYWYWVGMTVVEVTDREE